MSILDPFQYNDTIFGPFEGNFSGIKFADLPLRRRGEPPSFAHLFGKKSSFKGAQAGGGGTGLGTPEKCIFLEGYNPTKFH